MDKTSGIGRMKGKFLMMPKFTFKQRSLCLILLIFTVDTKRRLRDFAYPYS